MDYAIAAKLVGIGIFTVSFAGLMVFVLSSYIKEPKNEDQSGKN